MRWRVALVAGLAILVGLVLYAARPIAEPTTVLATPLITATPTTAQTATATPTTSPAASTQALTLTARPVVVPTDFKYVESWPGRIVMLDLAVRRAAEVATYTASSPEPGFPGAQISASADGRTLLILVRVSPTDGTLFVLRPENGDVRVIMRGPLTQAILSADGSRFAVARHDSDPLLTGLSVGAIADGTTRRLIADDPQLVGSPPVPFAFSFDGQLLVFGVGMGDTGYRGGVIAVVAPEVNAGRLRDPSVTTPGVAMLDAATGAEFISAGELFIWSSRGAFGGQTLAYTYRIAPKMTTALSSRRGDDRQLAEAAWQPGGDQFATLEQPSCCGVGIPRTPWLRGRDGSSRKLLEATPFLYGMWWSRDGTKLYAITGGDDSTGGVIDLMTGQSVMGFCKRGGAAPGSCT
jgi:hypothetical protein